MTTPLRTLGHIARWLTVPGAVVTMRPGSGGVEPI